MTHNTRVVIFRPHGSDAAALLQAYANNLTCHVFFSILCPKLGLISPCLPPHIQNAYDRWKAELDGAKREERMMVKSLNRDEGRGR